MSAISLPLFVGLAAAVLLLSSVALISLLLHRRRRRRESDLERGPPTARLDAVPNRCEPPAKGGDEQLRHFSWSEVESLTGNFAPTALIGEGGFSAVYLARLPDASLAAVKVHRGAASSERLHRAFRQELEILRRLRHPHVVRLLGYCDAGEGALVFEHVPNGSLDSRLHGSGGDEAGKALPWATRASVAYDVARALEYLHEVCDPPVVHGDVSSANVLLDARLEPRVCDFGCASAGFSGAVRPSARALMTGSPGYVDPHYLLTGVASKKGDVYGFGVLLLELLTGAEAFCAESGRSLAAAGGTGLPVDPRLGGEYDAGEAAALAALAARCVGEQPSLRPSMDEVVKFMAENVPSVLKMAVDGESNGKGSL